MRPVWSDMISEDWQYGVIGRRTKHVADTTSQLAVRVSFANSERVFLTKIKGKRTSEMRRILIAKSLT